jgi:hypothetical protein
MSALEGRTGLAPAPLTKLRRRAREVSEEDDKFCEDWHSGLQSSAVILLLAEPAACMSLLDRYRSFATLRTRLRNLARDEIMSGKLTNADLFAVFLLGAAIATGNPAFADFGIGSTVLPLLLIGLVAVLAGGFTSSAERGRFVLCWLAAAYVAFIFLWYEQYKLSGDSGSVALFTTLTDWLGLHGYEKAMRLSVGSCEILASLLILIPATQGLGGFGAVGIMSGAIFFHLATPLGVDPYGDGGILFKEAISVWTSGWLVVWWRREQLIRLALRLHLPVPEALRGSPN